MIAPAIGHQGRPVPDRLRVPEQGDETGAIALRIGRQFTQFQQSGVDGGQVDRCVTAAAWFAHIRGDNNEGDVVGFFPKGEFLDVIFLTKVKAVIRPKDYDRVIAAGGGIQCIENTADLGVGKGAAGSIGSNEVVIGSGNATIEVLHPLPEPLFASRQLPGTGRKVVPVVVQPSREVNVGMWLMILLRCEERGMGFEDAAGEE